MGEVSKNKNVIAAAERGEVWAQNEIAKSEGVSIQEYLENPDLYLDHQKQVVSESEKENLNIVAKNINDAIEASGIDINEIQGMSLGDVAKRMGDSEYADVLSRYDQLGYIVNEFVNGRVSGLSYNGTYSDTLADLEAKGKILSGANSDYETYMLGDLAQKEAVRQKQISEKESLLRAQSAIKDNTISGDDFNTIADYLDVSEEQIKNISNEADGFNKITEMMADRANLTDATVQALKNAGVDLEGTDAKTIKEKLESSDYITKFADMMSGYSASKDNTDRIREFMNAAASSENIEEMRKNATGWMKNSNGELDAFFKNNSDIAELYSKREAGYIDQSDFVKGIRDILIGDLTENAKSIISQSQSVGQMDYIAGKTNTLYGQQQVASALGITMDTYKKDKTTYDAIYKMQAKAAKDEQADFVKEIYKNLFDTETIKTNEGLQKAINDAISNDDELADVLNAFDAAGIEATIDELSGELKISFKNVYDHAADELQELEDSGFISRGTAQMKEILKTGNREEKLDAYAELDARGKNFYDATQIFRDLNNGGTLTTDKAKQLQSLLGLSDDRQNQIMASDNPAAAFAEEKNYLYGQQLHDLNALDVSRDQMTDWSAQKYSLYDPTRYNQNYGEQLLYEQRRNDLTDAILNAKSADEFMDMLGTGDLEWAEQTGDNSILEKFYEMFPAFIDIIGKAGSGEEIDWTGLQGQAAEAAGYGDLFGGRNFNDQMELANEKYGGNLFGDLFSGEIDTDGIDTLMEFMKTAEGADLSRVFDGLSNGDDLLRRISEGGYDAAEAMRELADAISQEVASEFGRFGKEADEVLSVMKQFKGSAKDVSSAQKSFNKMLSDANNTKFYADKFKSGSRDKDTLDEIADIVGLGTADIKDPQLYDQVVSQLDGFIQRDLQEIESWADGIINMNDIGAMISNAIKDGSLDIDLGSGSVSIDFSEIINTLGGLLDDTQKAMVELIQAFFVQGTLDLTQNDDKTITAK